MVNISYSNLDGQNILASISTGTAEEGCSAPERRLHQGKWRSSPRLLSTGSGLFRYASN